MPIPNNTRIRMAYGAARKDAVVEQPGTPAAAGEIAIWAATLVEERKTQQIIGDFHKLHRMAQTILPSLDGTADPDILHMVTGGSDNDIEVNGIPSAEQVRLEIGSIVGSNNRSHDLDRAFKLLIDRWLEESK